MHNRKIDDDYQYSIKLCKDSESLCNEAEKHQFEFGKEKSSIESKVEEKSALEKEKDEALVKKIQGILTAALKKIDEDKINAAQQLLINAIEVHQHYIEQQYHTDAGKKPICLEQRFAAFPDDSPLNVTNLHSCVFLVLRNPNNKFTLGIHIDDKLPREDIVNIISIYFDHLAVPKEQRKDYRLICHLFGGNAGADALDNIYSVLKELNVSMGQSNVSNKVQEYARPLNMTYNPATNECYEAMTPYSDPIRSESLVAFNLYDILYPTPPLITVATCKDNHFTKHPICDFTKEQIGEIMNSERAREIMDLMKNPAKLKQFIEGYKDVIKADHKEESCLMCSLFVCAFQYLNNKSNPQPTTNNKSEYRPDQKT